MSGYYHPQYPGGYYPRQQHPQQQHPQAVYHNQQVYQHPSATPWPTGSQYAAHLPSASAVPQQWPQQAGGHYTSAYSQQMHLNQGYSTQPYVDPRMSMHGYMAQQPALPPQPVAAATYPPQAYPQTVISPTQTVVSQPWGQSIPNGSAIPTTTPVTTVSIPQSTTSSPNRPLPSPGGSRPRPQSMPPNSLPAVAVRSDPPNHQTNSASQAPATTNSAFPRSSFDGISARSNSANVSNIVNRWPPSAPSTGTPITTSLHASRQSEVSTGDDSDSGKRPLPALPPSVFGVRAVRHSDDASLPVSPHSPVIKDASHTQPPEKGIPPAVSPSQPASVISTPSSNPAKRSLPTAPGGGGIQPGTILPKTPAGPPRSTTFPNATSATPSSIPTTSSLPSAMSRRFGSESSTTAVTSDDDKRPLWRRLAAAAGDSRAQGSSLSSRSITPDSRVERTSPKPPPGDFPKEASQTQSQIQVQHERTPSLPSTFQPIGPVTPKKVSVVSSPSRQGASPQPSSSRPTSGVDPTPHSHQRTSSVPATATSTKRPPKGPAQGEEGGQPRMSMFMKRASMSLQDHKNEDWAKWAMKSAAPTSPRTSPRSGPTRRPISVGSASDLDLDDAPPQPIHRGSFGKVSGGSKAPASAPQRQGPPATRPANRKGTSSNDAKRAPYPTYKPSYSDSEGEEENTSHPQIVVSSAVPQISVHTSANDRSPRKDVTPPRQPPASPKVPAISVTVGQPRKKSSVPAPPPVVPSFSFSIDGEEEEAAPPPKEKPLPPKVKKGGSRCGACEKAILGRIINAMGARWHPECFRCSVCDTGLEHISSYEHDERPYCHLCYHEVSGLPTTLPERQPDPTFSCLLLGAITAKLLSWKSTSLL